MLKLVSFDFDGTVADSVELCLQTFDRVFARYMGKDAPSREVIFREFGRNEPGILRSFLPRDWEQASADFFRLHKELHPVMCPEPFPGIRELLAELRDRGVKLALVTGRAPESCESSLRLLRLKPFFSVIRTGAPERNDKSAQLLEVAEAMGVKPEESLYVGDAVGDAVSDAEASFRAGVPCFSAAWAKSAHLSELKAINPDHVFPSVAELRLELLKRLEPAGENRD